MTRSEFETAVREVFPGHDGECGQSGMSDEWHAVYATLSIICRPTYIKHRWRVHSGGIMGHGKTLAEAVAEFYEKLTTFAQWSTDLLNALSTAKIP